MKPQSRKENIVVQSAQDETLVYDLKADKALLLNKTSAYIWNLCDGTKDVAQLSALLAEEFQQTNDETLVLLAIEQLKMNNLLADAADISISFAGNSRREAIRKIGLGSLVALPMISALLAPTAARAASTCAGDFQSCTIDNNTQSNCCNADRRCIGNCATCYGPGVSVGPLAVSQAQCDSNPLRNICCSSRTTYDGIYSCRCN